MELLAILTAAMVLASVAVIPILRSFEYEGDSKAVAFTAMLLHCMFAVVVGMSIMLLVGTVLGSLI